MEQVQIDHTEVDLLVVDERHRLPIGRPYATAEIDVAICTTLGVSRASTVAPRRFDHAKAVLRLEEMWRSFEHARVADPLNGMATWIRDVTDHHTGECGNGSSSGSPCSAERWPLAGRSVPSWARGRCPLAVTTPGAGCAGRRGPHDHQHREADGGKLTHATTQGVAAMAADVPQATDA